MKCIASFICHLTHHTSFICLNIKVQTCLIKLYIECMCRLIYCICKFRDINIAEEYVHGIGIVNCLMHIQTE